MLKLLAVVLVLASASAASARSNVDVDVNGSNIDVRVEVIEGDDPSGDDDNGSYGRMRPYRVQFCMTPAGSGPMAFPQYPGSPCWIPTPFGPAWGVVSN